MMTVPMRAPAVVLSARASSDGGATFFDVGGVSSAMLVESPGELEIRLPNAVPGRSLYRNIASGGLITRISMDALPFPNRAVRLRLALAGPCRSRLIAVPGAGRVRVRLESLDSAPAEEVRPTAAPGLYDVSAHESDLGSLLQTLARRANVSVVLTKPASGRVTLELRQTSIDRAIDLLAKSAGYVSHHDGATYLVGPSADVEPVEPKIQPPPPPVQRDEVYHCQHASAAGIVKSLMEMFDKEGLKVILGAPSSSPMLDQATTSAVTGVQASQVKQGSTESGPVAQDVILSGDGPVVDRALALARKMDRRRTQVRIAVNITDIEVGALKNLGIQWSWSNYTFQESSAAPTSSGSSSSSSTSSSSSATALSSGFNFGSFVHTPVSATATIAALEQQNLAKTLASPSISLLDGERGFILIGERLLYPTLVGYTQAQTPIFDKAEERIGIYVQVAVHVTDDGEITLTLYPQVSTVSGYLNVNDVQYPQISTREEQTTIRVKNGQQVIVGGLIQDQELKNIQKVPILSSIPFFGELFTWRSHTRNKTEVVIMITPEILKD
jgi:type II secretory pathway component GspD/PulD (secretin)